jgi:hypothetical protein
MNECYECDIGYKVEYCCGSHPETGEMTALEIEGGRVVRACPNLDELGDCKVYDSRPDPCSEYECPKLGEMDLFERLQSNIDSF